MGLASQARQSKRAYLRAPGQGGRQSGYGLVAQARRRRRRPRTVARFSPMARMASGGWKRQS